MIITDEIATTNMPDKNSMAWDVEETTIKKASERDRKEGRKRKSGRLKRKKGKKGKKAGSLGASR